MFYEESLKTGAAKKRKELYIKMDSMVMEEAPIIPLYYDQSVRFISKQVINLKGDAINMLDLTRVKKNDSRDYLNQN